MAEGKSASERHMMEIERKARRVAEGVRRLRECKDAYHAAATIEHAANADRHFTSERNKLAELINDLAAAIW